MGAPALSISLLVIDDNQFEGLYKELKNKTS
jgi:hypothetical protein